MTTKAKYKVLAATGFDGHAEGEEFEATLDPELEERAIERGSIEAVGKRKAKEEGDG